MTEPILPRLTSPADLACLSLDEMNQLAGEVRGCLTDVVGRNGGHLASNLGAVEITLALHRVYDFRHDRLVFDVGHQCYTQKLLTGRHPRFGTLRQYGGLTGFPSPRESEYDPFVVGHASTSISSAVGLAAAWRLQNLPHKAVAFVGDGAIGGGMCFEAMNHAGHAGEDVLVLLNDNDMAIAETVGAFSKYLTEIRSTPLAHRMREELHRALAHIPVIGQSLDWAQDRVLDAVKGMIDESHIFSAMGFRYFGPLDGHDIRLLEDELRKLRALPGPKLLHVVTSKGHGFHAAAADPETYHSAVPFEVRGSGQVVPKGSSGESWTSRFVKRLRERAAKDPKVVAITAAMPAGTGIKTFAQEFPGRFFDVGICEAHSVTFAAGLAKAGLRPVLAIYSTFLQRGYDQIVHDVAVQPDLPVVFALDRAGLVGEDGPTHHGIFDIAFLRHIPGLTLMAPRDGEELELMLDWALQQPGPVAIRYPRGNVPALHELPVARTPVERGRGEILKDGPDGAILAYGRMVLPAMEAAARLEDEGLRLTVVNARFTKPLDVELLRRLADRPLVTVEDHALAGGFGSAVAEALAGAGLTTPLTRLGIPDRFIEHGSIAQLDALLGLDVHGLTESFRRACRRTGAAATLGG